MAGQAPGWERKHVPEQQIGYKHISNTFPRRFAKPNQHLSKIRLDIAFEVSEAIANDGKKCELLHMVLTWQNTSQKVSKICYTDELDICVALSRLNIGVALS